MRHADEDTRGGARHRRRRTARVLNGLPGRLQQHPVLRIHGGGLALVDAEEIGVEAGHVVEECAPLGDRAARHALLGIIEVVGVPAIGGDLGDEVVAAQQRLPEFVRRVDAARQAAGHADHGDRSQGSTHGAHTSSSFTAGQVVSLPGMPRVPAMVKRSVASTSTRSCQCFAQSNGLRRKKRDLFPASAIRNTANSIPGSASSPYRPNLFARCCAIAFARVPSHPSAHPLNLPTSNPIFTAHTAFGAATGKPRH